MKVFVSYSFNERQSYLIALLHDKLSAAGNTIQSSEFYSHNAHEINSNKITMSDFFIGIITNNSRSSSFVIDEWRVAINHNMKNILLIEEGVPVGEGVNFIRFNRNHPQTAVEAIIRNVEESNTGSNKELKDALIAGGIIAGIAALIALLAGSDKK